MEIKRLNNIENNDLKEIAVKMKEGRIVIFPTETVYGVGTNALDKKACEKIFEIKGRPNNKPLIVLIYDFEMLKTIVQEPNEIEKELMEKFWPGPLTIILKKKSCISDVVTAGKEDVGIRMTSGEVARRLIEIAKVPIVAPSANLSGNPTGIKPDDIIRDLGDKVDYMIDCGYIKSETTSTVIKVEDKKIKVLREGVISKKELEKIAEIKN